MFVSYMQLHVCVVYVVKEVASFWGLGQLMAWYAIELELYRPAGRKLLVAHIETRNI